MPQPPETTTEDDIQDESEEDTTDENPSEETDEEKTTEDHNDTDEVDYSEVDLETLKKKNPEVAELVKEANEAKEKLTKKEEAEKEQEKKKAKEKGKFQELYEVAETEIKQVKAERDEKEEILTKYVDTVKNILKGIENDIPEENKGLIPEDYSPRQRLEYITNNAKVLGVSVTSKGSKINSNEDTPNLTEEQSIRRRLKELDKKNTLTYEEEDEMFDLSQKLKAITT